MSQAHKEFDGYSALVVDDEPTIRLMTAEYLRQDGFSVMEAESGEQAIDMVGRDRPSIVLLDVIMPRMDGFDTCVSIRGNEGTSNLPVLMMTGLDDQESIRRAYDAGTTDFITKPVNWNLLRYRMRYILKASSTHEKLCEAEDRNSAIVQALPDMLFILNKDGMILDINFGQDNTDAYAQPDNIIGRGLNDILPQRIATRSAEYISRAIDTGEMQAFEYMLPFGKQRRYFEARIKSFGRDTALALVRNVTARKSNDKKLREYQNKLEDLVDCRTAELSATIARLGTEVDEKRRIADELGMLDKAARTTMTGITISDISRRILYVNPAEARMHGYETTQLIGAQVDIFSPDELVSPMSMEDLVYAASWCRESVNIRKDGTRFPVRLVSDIVRDDAGKPTMLVTTCHDISEQKKTESELKEYHDHLEELVELRTNDLNATVAKLKREMDIRIKQDEKIEHLAYHDCLTGLPNRTLFSKQLWHEIAKAKDCGHSIALMYIDLDNFKNINDTLGHTIGDFILCEVGRRLSHITRRDDSLIAGPNAGGESMVSRLGGDEFILLLPGIENRGDVEVIAKRILAAMSAPVNLDCHEIFIKPSIGIALYPEHGFDADTLLMNADTAMYNAKNEGKNTFRFYTSSMSEESMRFLMLENDLHRALVRDELKVFYQPQYDIETGNIICIEALIRWEHRQHGMIMPDSFIGIAEQYGLIIPIGNLVLSKVCKQIISWRDRGKGAVKVAINVSGIQFQQNFTNTVRKMLNEFSVPAELLELEITESSLMRDPGNAINTLNELKALGLSVALDDFGTGYSSLNYLRKFPIDALKIDRSFIAEIMMSKDNDNIIKAIIAMAHSMNMKVIAEGVETEGQLDFLRELGCDSVQGYYYHKPMRAKDIEALLADELRECA